VVIPEAVFCEMTSLYFTFYGILLPFLTNCLKYLFNLNFRKKNKAYVGLSHSLYITLLIPPSLSIWNIT
jgi:hypothetical protein